MMILKNYSLASIRDIDLFDRNEAKIKKKYG